MSDQTASFYFIKLRGVIIMPIVTLAFVTATSPINFQIIYAYECADDKDWPDMTKPCPLYGAESDAELRERWDKYYELKGQDWMQSKKVEMDQAIRNGTFTEWIRYAPDNSHANRNVYFYYRLNNQAPLMVIDPQSNQYFMPKEQDPSMYIYAPMSGDYYAKPSIPPWYTTTEGIYAIIGVGSTGAAGSFLALWKVRQK